MPHALRAYLRLVASTYQQSGGKLDNSDMLADSFRVAALRFNLRDARMAETLRARLKTNAENRE